MIEKYKVIIRSARNHFHAELAEFFSHCRRIFDNLLLIGFKLGKIAQLIAKTAEGKEKVFDEVNAEVAKLCKAYPLYADCVK